MIITKTGVPNVRTWGLEYRVTLSPCDGMEVIKIRENGRKRKPATPPVINDVTNTSRLFGPVVVPPFGFLREKTNRTVKARAQGAEYRIPPRSGRRVKGWDRIS